MNLINGQVNGTCAITVSFSQLLTGGIDLFGRLFLLIIKILLFKTSRHQLEMRDEDKVRTGVMISWR